MKRFFAFTLTLITVLCLAACSVPTKNSSSRKNGLNTAFSANVSIVLDKLNAEGTIKRFGDGLWEIEFSSPNTLSGVLLKFSEGNIEASYKGLSFSVPQTAYPVKAAMLNLMDAVDTNARLSELKGEEKNDSLAVSGKLKAGEYVLTVDKNGQLSGFSMDSFKLDMRFSDIAPIGETASEGSENDTTGTAAPDTTAAAE